MADKEMGGLVETGRQTEQFIDASTEMQLYIFS